MEERDDILLLGYIHHAITERERLGGWCPHCLDQLHDLIESIQARQLEQSQVATN